DDSATSRCRDNLCRHRPSVAGVANCGVWLRIRSSRIPDGCARNNGDLHYGPAMATAGDALDAGVVCMDRKFADRVGRLGCCACARIPRGSSTHSVYSLHAVDCGCWDTRDAIPWGPSIITRASFVAASDWTGYVAGRDACAPRRTVRALNILRPSG